MKSADRPIQMTLGSHLAELRRRAVRAAAGIVLGTLAGWFLAPLVLASIRAPILEAAKVQHRLASLNFDTIT